MAIDLSGRSLVLGLGATGLSVAHYLGERGLRFRIADSRESPPCLGLLEAQDPDADMVLGSLDVGLLEGVSRVFVSPGLAQDLPLIAAARRLGLPVINDIELFAHEARAPVIAVTGSNGKSTVTSLVAEMLGAQGFNAPAGGNLGPPALELLDVTDADAYVLEISSFQMELVDSLRPRAAAVLNVSADHLDRHGSLEAYAGLKEKLLAASECAVVNWDDPIVRAMGQRHHNTLAFSIRVELEHGYSMVVREDRRYLAKDGKLLMAADDIAMPGLHNLQNALAALALVELLGGEREPALEALRRFRGLPHRCEFIASRRGVDYVNDSKATNVAATVAALSGFDKPLVLIAGGESKGADFSPLVEQVGRHAKAAILIGKAAPELGETLESVCEIRKAGTLEDAVAQAAALAVEGDTVLLSPACSSLDMFDDYRERGHAFAEAVERLES